MTVIERAKYADGTTEHMIMASEQNAAQNLKVHVINIFKML